MNDVSHHEATMRFVYGYVVRKNMSPPGGGGHSHWPVYVMPLWTDPLICIGLSLNAPFFTTLNQMNHYFCFLDQHFSREIINFLKFCTSQWKFQEKINKIAWILCNFTLNDPPFLDVTQSWPLYCKKLSLIALWFDVSVGAPPCKCLNPPSPWCPGVLGFILDKGVVLEPWNPYPILRVILAEKDTHI